MTGLPQGLKSYLRAPFVVIVWVMETYTKNRARLKAVMARPRVSFAFKMLLVLTAVIWITVAILANGKQGGRLTDAVKGILSDAKNVSAERKALQNVEEPTQ
ncbi:MAG: hypothetical protein JKY17_05400 [Magnetovibrio sp.]|nr:hypothetical protein [Magnetovibrio sp.]